MGYLTKKIKITLFKYYKFIEECYQVAIQILKESYKKRTPTLIDILNYNDIFRGKNQQSVSNKLEKKYKEEIEELKNTNKIIRDTGMTTETCTFIDILTSEKNDWKKKYNEVRDKNDLLLKEIEELKKLNVCKTEYIIDDENINDKMSTLTIEENFLDNTNDSDTSEESDME